MIELLFFSYDSMTEFEFNSNLAHFVSSALLLFMRADIFVSISGSEK